MEKTCLICGKELENRRRKVCPGECARLRRKQTKVACNLRKRNSFPEAAWVKSVELQSLEMEQANA